MRYLVKLDELNDRCNEIINYSKKDINQKIESLDQLKNNFEWAGKAHDSFIASYNNEIVKIKELNQQMTLLGEFLLLFQNDYNDTQKKLAEMMQSYLDEIEAGKR